MDLESECPALESVEDNEVNPDRISQIDENKIENNGSCATETERFCSGKNVDANTLLADSKWKESVESVQQVNSPPLTAKSPGGGSPPASKGYGLKKWRRIRRDFVKDASASVDSSKILKRGFSAPGNPTKPTNLSVLTKQNSEGNVGSVNMLTNVGVDDGFPMRDSSLDSRFAVGSAFTGGTDSENSEDQSSKSSTAASAPKARYDLPAVLGYVREKNRMKNLIGKSLGNSVQRVQQGKGRIESSKKHRGERVKIEKENSHSSVESDSRSSNFVFAHFSVTSNGKQTGRTMNYDRENSEEAHASEQLFSEELQTGYHKENVGEVEDLSQDDLAADLSWEVREEKSQNHKPSADRDPLVDSILNLQLLQEALEREVQKFGEIGRDPVSLYDNSINLGSDELVSEERESASGSLETQLLSMKLNVKVLESKLDEARAMLEAKETRVSELEATLNISKSLKEESGSIIELQQEKSRELQTELESLFKEKIEAEVEYLAMTRTIQNLRLAAGNQIMVFEEQKTLARVQAEMLNKLGEAESRATMLKKEADELEKYRGDILGTEEVLKMQRRACEATSCFFIQLILLVFVIWLFVLQLSPHPGEVVPT